MCKNFTAFAAGVVALSFLGLGSRICIAEMMRSSIHASCPACEIAFWIAAFALPLFVGLFVGAFGGSRGWICAGTAAVVALVVRTYVVGMGFQEMINTPSLAGLSLLYVAVAVVGGVIGSAVVSHRPAFTQSAQKKKACVEPSGTAQSHSHDNLAF